MNVRATGAEIAGHHADGEAERVVASLVARARAAQRAFEMQDNQRSTPPPTPPRGPSCSRKRNRQLAEPRRARYGSRQRRRQVPQELSQNARPATRPARTEDHRRDRGKTGRSGIVEIARAVGVVAAITPSTNPAATPANKIINALKCGNAVIVAPSPKGYSSCALLIEFIHAQFAKAGIDPDLVQMLPAPISKAATAALMRQCDLVVATGSQANVRMAYASGTPAFGVGAGNVASIVTASADLHDAARKILRSKTFDNATSCSSENSVVIEDAVYQPMLTELAACGGVLLDADQKARLQAVMWVNGKLSEPCTAKSAERDRARGGSG